MKITLIATILFATLALTSCSEAPPPVGDYVAKSKSKSTGDAQGATPESAGAVPETTPATPDTQATSTPGTAPPATSTPGTPPPATPKPTQTPGTPPPATPKPTQTPSILTYANLNVKVFTPYCTACHGNKGGVNLETYAKVKAFAAGVKNTAITQATMPPGKPLPADLQKLLGDWIAAGTPEK